MISPHAATDVLVPGNALSEIQEHGPRRIGFLSLLIVLIDLRRRDRRTIIFLTADSLGIVRFVAVHPADDRGIVLVREPRGVLWADDVHSMLFESRELLVRRSAPQTYVQIDACSLVARRIGRMLEPDC